MCFDAPRRNASHGEMLVRDATSLVVKHGIFQWHHTPYHTVTAGANTLNFMTQNTSF
ncbi:MAG: hypothetical protein KME29_13405 [Calothrix sp. FI2-JRJ7]|jgi:hypothetical protein|nr:hypothetical protein [Calothrix sp. FI2-JRJ7]